MKTRLTLLLFTLALCSSLGAQDHTYANARLDIGNNEDFSSFSMLDTTVGRYNVFFSGENHRFWASNAKLELKMLKYLHKKAGVKHLLLEFGFTSGYLVDRYVNYNDTSAYDILKAYFSSTYLWLFKGIKDYNAGLDSSKKVRVHGIDFEDDMFFSVRAIAKMMPDKEAPEEIGLQIETLRNMDLRYSKNGINGLRSGHYGYGTGLGTGIYGNYYKADSTMKDVVKCFEHNRDAFDEYFGKNAAVFATMMEHVKYYLEWQQMISSGKMQERPYRERYMYNNFVKLVEKNPGEKFFGQFGRCHTSFNRTDPDCDINYYNSLVGKINTHQSDYLNNKVCVIAGIYPKLEFVTFKLHSYDILQKLKKAASDTGITLFPVMDDTVHFGDLHKHYKYIFINNNYPSQETEITNTPAKARKTGFFADADNLDFFVGLSYNLQFSGIKTTKLQPFYDHYGLTAPSSPLLMHGISLEVMDDLMGNYVTMGYFWLPNKDINTSDTSVLSLSASFANLRVGHDLKDVSPLINIIPYFGIGYNELRIRHVIDNSDQLFQSETTLAEITYKNPAVLVDFGLHFSTRIYFLGLTAYGGYQLDCSSKKWRKDGTYSAAAPSMSLGGWYAGVNIGLFIFE